MSITRIGTGPRMSKAVIHGNTVYLSGQVASTTKVLSANIWLTDISTFAEMNGVWDGWVAAGCTPARATVEAKLAAPEYKVEIAVVAAR